MTVAELIEEFDRGRAISAVLELKNRPKGLGEGFPQTCQTAYTIGWLEALAAAAAALRELPSPRASVRGSDV